MSINLIDSPEAFKNRSHKNDSTEIHHYRFKESKFENYLFKDFALSEPEQKALMTLVNFWYFDEQGKDSTKFNNFSWGNLFKCGLLSSLPFLYREYLALKKLNSDSVLISKSEHENFKFLAQKIFSKVALAEPTRRQSFIDMYIRRVLPDAPNKNSFRFLSRFNFLKNNQKLTISDGATVKFYEAQKDFLILNRKDLVRGYFHTLSNHSGLEKKYRPPWLIDNSYYLKLIENANTRLRTGIDSQFLKIFSEYIVFHYSAQAEKYIQWINFFDSLFNQRKFTEFHVPGERFEPYLIGAQLAKIYGAKICLIWDGFSSTENPAYMYDDKNWLFNDYIVFDRASLNALARQGIENARLKLYENPHPILTNPPNQSQRDFDVVIFSWISQEYNPFCLPDRLPEILAQFAKLLVEKDLKVAVKSKSKAMTQIYSEFLSDELKQKITFLEGPPANAIARAKVVVTGLSTTILETEYLQAPVVIYEPIENGYSDFTIQEELKQKYKICRNDNEALAEITRLLK